MGRWWCGLISDCSWGCWITDIRGKRARVRNPTPQAPLSGTLTPHLGRATVTSTTCWTWNKPQPADHVMIKLFAKDGMHCIRCTHNYHMHVQCQKIQAAYSPLWPTRATRGIGIHKHCCWCQHTVIHDVESCLLHVMLLRLR